MSTCHSLHKLAAEFRTLRSLPRPAELSGLCAKTSAAFVEWLSERGVVAELVTGHCSLGGDDDNGASNHAWIEIDGMIVDLTAQQFDPMLPEVLVVGADDEGYTARVRGRMAWVKCAAAWTPAQRIPITPFVAAVWRSGMVQSNHRTILEQAEAQF